MEGYAAAMRKLESPDQGVLNRLLGSISEGTQGVGPEGRSLLAKRALSKMGVSVGMGQASKIIAAYQDGRPPDIAALMAQKDRLGDSKGMGAEARRRVGIGAGLTRSAAGLEAQRIGVGQGAAKFMVQFEQNSLKAAGVINNFGKDLSNLSGIVKSAIEAIGDFTKGGGASTFNRIIAQIKALLGVAEASSKVGAAIGQ